MKRVYKNRKPDNFTSLASQTQTVLKDGYSSPDVVLGTDPLVFRNYTLGRPLVKLAPAPDTVIKEPTLIIPATEPTEIKTPTAQLTSGAKLQTSSFIEKTPQDYVPVVDPIVSDKTYTFKPLNTTGSLTDYAAQIRQQFAKPAATAQPASGFNWWLVVIAILVIAGIIYLKKKGKI